MLVTMVLNWRQLAEGDTLAVSVSSVPDDPVLALIHSCVELPCACASTAVAVSPMRVASEYASVEGSGCCSATGAPIEAVVSGAASPSMIDMEQPARRSGLARSSAMRLVAPRLRQL